jgi:hypothetical protein
MTVIVMALMDHTAFPATVLTHQRKVVTHFVIRWVTSTEQHLIVIPPTAAMDVKTTVTDNLSP